ncbi:prenyltransferase, partial [Sulfurovum sp. bin170]|uniref:heparinase II/III family protein n=1 Tax=Sulfurovum sp. bin170 TaxID=2695268 RepID=UPI001418DE3A
ISYKNGDIPLFNDSTKGIAPTTEQLMQYAKNLKFKIQNSKLVDSGYRKISNENYECIVDIGHIGADYIAGHAHSDTFNFELRLDGKPFIVDTGLSTYETCERRTVERSTVSHNTVEVNGKNQSEVWGGFRVANRATVIDFKEDDNSIEATHNGYRPILHTRKWSFKEGRVVIEDNLNNNSEGVARLHFHPDVTKEKILSHISMSSDRLKFGEYLYSPKFNTKLTAIVISIKFRENLKIEILNVCN